MKQFWLPVREAVGAAPLVEGMICGKTPLYVERYIYRRKVLRMPNVDGLHLLTHLGGPAAQGGEAGGWQQRSLPMQSGLVPLGCAGQWNYRGAVDFAAFYFVEPASAGTRRFLEFAGDEHRPLPFTDILVSATAWRIVDELQRGQAADADYLALLAEVMLEQSWRALTASGDEGIRPRHVHASRLEAVFKHIGEHLADDLTVDVLAVVAGLSESHFRQIFQQSTGEPPHRYVLKVRLEQACKLLRVTELPLAQVADECGFSSQSHMTAKFREIYAATPSEFRNGKGKA